MSCILTSGRAEISCRDNIGGIKAVYLFKYVSYDHTQIVGTRGAEITSFPETTVYKYEIADGSFDESINNDENGVSYDQTLTFSLNKQDVETVTELHRLSNISLRYVVEYNAGYYKIGGLYKGANVDNINITTGGNKSDKNGYSVTINSSEEWKAPFISFNFFIDEDDLGKLFQDGNNFIFQDDNNYIF